MTAKVKYNEKDKAIVEALRDAENGLTLAEISEKVGYNIAPGSITAAIGKGLVEVSETQRIVERPTTREVSTYIFRTDEVLTGEDGKVFNYTGGENAILAAAKNFTEPFTLAELAAAMGLEKLTSGSINSLVNKKGNLEATEEKKKVPAVTRAKVNVYLFKAEVPTTE